MMENLNLPDPIHDDLRAVMPQEVDAETLERASMRIQAGIAARALARRKRRRLLTFILAIQVACLSVGLLLTRLGKVTGPSQPGHIDPLPDWLMHPYTLGGLWLLSLLFAADFWLRDRIRQRMRS